MSKLSPGETVSESNVLEVSGFIEPSVIENWLKAAIYASSMAVPKQKSFRKEIFQGVSNLIPGVRGE